MDYTGAQNFGYTTHQSHDTIEQQQSPWDPNQKFEEEPLPDVDEFFNTADNKYHCPYAKSNGKECKKIEKSGRDMKYAQSFIVYDALLIPCRKHIRQHWRPVKCPRLDCEHRDVESRDMRRHIEVAHPLWAQASGHHLKKFKCPNCDSKFSREDNMKRHLKDCD
jgi:hypothetical protein